MQCVRQKVMKKGGGLVIVTSPYYEKNLISNFLYMIIISTKHEETMLFV